MRYRARKCRCCRQWYLPQPHNAYHQRYCVQPACRLASKRHSQRKWLRKNPDQHRGPENVTRVRDWRARHPGYGREAKRRHRLRLDVFAPRRLSVTCRIHLRADHAVSGALQDVFLPQRVCLQQIAADLERALQELIGAFLARCYVAFEA